MAKKWRYEKLDENFNTKTIMEGNNDVDGSITGHVVINVKAWFDENPEERIRLGWTKHYFDDEKPAGYNPQTQNLIVSAKQIDDYTIEDEYHVVNKSEEQLAFEDMFSMMQGGNIMWFGIE